MNTPHRLPNELSRLITALLFLHADPVDLNDLSQWMDLSADQLRPLMERLNQTLDCVGLSLSYAEDQVALTTASDLDPALTELVDVARSEPEALSHGAWETLAVVAYKQPITRLEVEFHRQTGSERTLTTLQERGLIEEVGRKETPGRPILYGTTAYFLQQFGLTGVSALPPLAADDAKTPEV